MDLNYAYRRIKNGYLYQSYFDLMLQLKAKESLVTIRHEALMTSAEVNEVQ